MDAYVRALYCAGKLSEDDAANILEGGAAELQQAIPYNRWRHGPFSWMDKVLQEMNRNMYGALIAKYPDTGLELQARLEALRETATNTGFRRS